MKKIQILIFLIIGNLTFSQIRFEKGYFISNSGEKKECLIKNIEWSKNPRDFDYKFDANAAVETQNIANCQEFGIDGQSKYIRSTVFIDYSSEITHQINYNKEPEFKEETVFLKVIIEGKANLYSYIKGNMKRYFYSNSGSKIEQLVYKLYLIDNKTIKKNAKYKQQLWENLKCESLAMDRFDRVAYDETSLKKIITEYNNCHQVATTTFKKQKKFKELIDITIRPRINFSSFEMQTNLLNPTDVKFEKSTNFGFGIEAEYIIPFFKNKWGLSIEPSFINSKFEQTNVMLTNVGFPVKIELNYSIIELPLTIRHYFHLSNSSKIFVNISYVYGITRNAEMKTYRTDNTFINSYEFSRSNTFGYGIGYKYNSKFSVESRFFSNRTFSPEYLGRYQNFENFSLFLGYTLF